MKPGAVKININHKKNCMKNLLSFMLVFLVPTLSGCEIIGGIFKAGVWVGVLIVAVIVGLVIFLISKSRK